MDDSIPRSILLILGLILCGGFFAGCETAFSFCNEVRMRTMAEDGNRRARQLTRILDDFDRTIVTLLIIINIVYILVASVATMAAVKLMGPAGSVIATAVTTLCVFMFSETIPKNIARANSDSYALFAAYPIAFFRFVLTPLSALFTRVGEIAKRLLPKKPAQPDVTEDEFEELVENAREDGQLEAVEKDIIKSTIHFGDIMAGDVMTPLDKIVGIPVDIAPEALREILVEEKFSRFPVYDGDIDHIVGVLRSSAVLYKLMNGAPVDIRDVITRPYIIRTDLPVNKVFEGMSGRRTHMAIIADNGKTCGLITMEDILEEIVGEIYDEDDVESRADSGKGGQQA